MQMKRKQLKQLIVEVAKEQYGSARFRRRELLSAVQKELGSRNLWTTEDDEPSSLMGSKSKGMANIDWGFSELAREGQLVRTERNTWQVAPSILEAANIIKAPPLGDVTLLVEGDSDIPIVQWILQAASIPLDRIVINAVGPKTHIARYAREIDQESSLYYAALIDADEQSVPDSKEYARELLGYPPFPVFCAVPEIEAWLFADDVTAERHAKNDYAKAVVRRLPLPEFIPYPKQLSVKVFGPGRFDVHQLGFLKEIDIDRAAARSPSLRDFLLGISDLLNEPISFNYVDIPDQTSHEIFVSLINEVAKSDVVLWRTADGSELTAKILLDEIERGTPLGKQYISEILRVARDMIARQSRRR